MVSHVEYIRRAVQTDGRTDRQRDDTRPKLRFLLDAASVILDEVMQSTPWAIETCHFIVSL